MDLGSDVAAMIAGTKPLPDYDRRMGFRLVSASAEGAVMEATVGAGEWVNPTGVLHGGVLMGLADSSMGMTMCSLLGAGQAGTNTDLQMRFLRPTTAGRLRATTRVVRRGNRTIVLECDVTDAAAKLVARASSMFLVLDAAGFAQGRGPS
jgi:uncharacterized protein (TIGR00369 family)